MKSQPSQCGKGTKESENRRKNYWESGAEELARAELIEEVGGGEEHVMKQMYSDGIGLHGSRSRTLNETHVMGTVENQELVLTNGPRFHKAQVMNSQTECGLGLN